MLQFAVTVIALIGVAFYLRSALAAGWHYYDPDCPIPLGAKTMKFVAMQPKKSIDRVCGALPETGPTIIALDAPDLELREMDWDIRILHDIGRRDGDENAESEIVFRLPVQKFRNGMANFDHNFVDAGKYILFAKMTSDDGAKEYIGRHHFTVGVIDNTDFYAYVLFACLVVASGGVYALIVLRKRKSALRV